MRRKEMKEEESRECRVQSEDEEKKKKKKET
jgi:hypothetical protein